MQITETKVDGLKREYKIVIPAPFIEQELQKELQFLGGKAKVPGFRPGKAPMTLLRQRYGSSVTGDVIDKAVREASQKALKDRDLKAALRPKIEVISFQEGQDLSCSMAVEVLPKIEIKEFKGLSLQRPIATVAETAVDEALQRLAQSRRERKLKGAEQTAEKGDVVIIDFNGTVDGVARPGMKGEKASLELGSKRFIDTFEDQLVGTKAGTHKKVHVTFPKDYNVADLAGKKAEFDVDVKEVYQQITPVIDATFAKAFGQDTTEKLRETIHKRLTEDYARFSRQHVKRKLLDELAKQYAFPIPEGMVNLEFDAIWDNAQKEQERTKGKTQKGKDEAALKKEYREIAERRIRLGLLLAEVGRQHKIQVTPDEINKAVYEEARHFPAMAQQVLDYYRKGEEAVEGLRARLFEDKVVDFIISQANVKDQAVSAEELMKDPNEDNDE